jgi:hypothetical protein
MGGYRSALSVQLLESSDGRWLRPSLMCDSSVGRARATRAKIGHSKVIECLSESC